MSLNSKIDINFWNHQLRYKWPEEIIRWAMTHSEKRILTTSFGHYSEVLINAIHQFDNNIKVIWCDTLYHSKSTYDHSEALTSKYNLNIVIYKALKSKEEIEMTFDMQNMSTTKFEEFSNLVKIEPFIRALKEQNPDIWFTNIRKSQTEFRNTKDILSYSKEGLLKVSPFFYWSDTELNNYMTFEELKTNDDYFDPIKILKNRECGIHYQ